ncbi:MAG: ribonucleoside-diphosphate reductase alpha chain [Lentisphaeria bacterium]|jgi:ribonucleoside-diphosphate reductase alpha chain
MASTYDFAEPGFILIDRVNELNNNWFCKHIRATNPCGEQPLLPYGSCLLGPINLTQCVEQPFSEQAHFNWDKYRKVIATFTRMLDNVVEINGLALPQQQQEIINKRRHGMGFWGLGSTFALLRIPYCSTASVAFNLENSVEILTGKYKIA